MTQGENFSVTLFSLLQKLSFYAMIDMHFDLRRVFAMKKLCSMLLAVCMAAGLLGLLCAVPAAALETYEPPANLGALSQAEQLAYFNLVVNRVRTEKPGFRQRERLQIVGMRSSLMGGALDGMIGSIVGNLMSGDWYQISVAADQSNQGLFMSENANASDLRPEDIISITSTKQGDNWIMDLRIKEEANPAPGLDSANGRIAPIATREGIVAELVGSGITANPADAAVNYGSGFARVTVNGQGQVIVAANGYQLHSQINNVSVSVITFDAAITMNSEWQYAYFGWAPEEPFPPANSFPDAGSGSIDPIPALKWWQRLPSLFQWILRYFFFGWIWMR